MARRIKQDAVTTRWSARRPLYATAAFLTVVFFLVLLAMMDAANDGNATLGVLALIVVGGLVLGLLRYASHTVVVLTSDHLRLHMRGPGRRDVDLARIRAVALVRSFPGWAVFVWADDGAPLRLAAPTRVFRLKSQSTATPDASYWAEVASSPAGTCAEQIYRQADAAQGGAGPLHRHDAETLVAQDRHVFAGAPTPWWSPTGEHGVLP